MNLVIRQPQLNSLVKSHSIGQAAALYPSLEALFPERCAILGKQGVIELVERNLAFAYARGFEEGRHTSLIADLVMRWGDLTMGEVAWATEVVNDTGVDAGLLVRELERRSEARMISMELEKLLFGTAGAE
ncbi:MAG: hypothetical protein FJW38_06250 [Acidobacteria bacterium]|nr:hypothetical protein [Acidobacteriota bacterium]